MKKKYISPALSFENVYPDTAISSTAFVCSDCEATTGRKPGGPKKAPDYGLQSGDTFYIDTIPGLYFNCFAVIGT